MGPLRCRWLVAAAAVVGILGAAVPTVVARRLRPNDVSGTYTLYGNQRDGEAKCPDSLALGVARRRTDEDPVWMVDYLDGTISQDGAVCDKGNLEVIRTLGLVNEKFRADHGLEEEFALFNVTTDIEWSDSVGIGMGSLKCGNKLQWSNTTVLLFGNDGWFVDYENDGPVLEIEDGRPHVMIVEGIYLLCILRGPRPTPAAAVPGEDRSLPEGGGRGSDLAGGLSAGPVAGIAVGAAVVGAAAAAAVALGYRRWAATRGGGGGGGDGGGGGGGVPSRGLWAGPPTWPPGPPSRRSSVATTAPPPTGIGGGTPPPPYPLPPSSPISAEVAVVRAGPPGDKAGVPPSIPPGLLYNWEVPTPPSGADVTPPVDR